MPRAGPSAVRKYSDEFKLTAVRLSQQPGLQVKTVAAALTIHPFMLSKWRKDARDGRLRGRARKAPPPGQAREIAQLQALEKAHALLQEEHELLKKAIRFCSARKATRSPSSTRSARGESAHAGQDRLLTREIERLFSAHRERYGSPRLYQLLHNAGWIVSRRRVARLMRASGLRAKAVQGYRSKMNVRRPRAAPGAISRRRRQ